MGWGEGVYRDNEECVRCVRCVRHLPPRPWPDHHRGPGAGGAGEERQAWVCDQSTFLPSPVSSYFSPNFRVFSRPYFPAPGGSWCPDLSSPSLFRWKNWLNRSKTDRLIIRSWKASKQFCCWNLIFDLKHVCWVLSLFHLSSKIEVCLFVYLQDPLGNCCSKMEVGREGQPAASSL